MPLGYGLLQVNSSERWLFRFQQQSAIFDWFILTVLPYDLNLQQKTWNMLNM